jgi:hypothetical protein
MPWRENLKMPAQLTAPAIYAANIQMQQMKVLTMNRVQAMAVKGCKVHTLHYHAADAIVTRLMYL